MTFTQIAIFIALAVVYALLPKNRRGWMLFLVSVVAIYALQPTLNIRWLDYSLPSLTLVVVVICWYVTRPPVEAGERQNFSRDDLLSLLTIGVVILLLTLPRYLTLPIQFTSRPPEVFSAVIGLVVAGVFTLLLSRMPPRFRYVVALVGLIAAFIVIKTPPLATWLSEALRRLAAQDVSLASPLDIEWLGFSYVAFRLIHTVRDRQSGLLPSLSLREFVTYAVFFPAYTAGPIDRAERFVEDYRDLPALDGERITLAGSRITMGMFKKFVIADSLALFSLNATMAEQAQSTSALWVMLYAYAFRLFFDFSGYTDIAIGIGILFGIKLPENFNRPYLKNNLATFWQSWHITLSNWARTYIYSPLSRNLLRRKSRPSNDMIVLVCNVATMGVIGLWHGVTFPFLLWGLWHAMGLTVHKLWSDRTRSWYRGLQTDTRKRRLWYWAGVALTFHFVLLGWVWFALPDMVTAVRVFVGLFGFEF
jgi:alginate O-acetyltransferase complex protein AlgI